jgi:hypothetical protein
VLKRQGRLVAGGEGGRGYEDIVVCPEGAHVYGIPAQISGSFDNYITKSRTLKDLNYPKRLLLAKIKKSVFLLNSSSSMISENVIFHSLLPTFLLQRNV